MSVYACIDTEGKVIKNANNLTHADKSKYNFYCINEDCRVKLSLNIYQNANNRFKASYDNESHINNCWAHHEATKTVVYPSKKRDLDEIVNNLMKSINKKDRKNKVEKKYNRNNGNKKMTHREMSTLRDIHLYCKAHDINEYLYDKQIKHIFLDNRSEYIYTKYMEEGNKIVCYNMSHYKPNEKFIIKYNGLTLNIYFENNNIYTKVQNKLDLKGKSLSNIVILFAGEWRKERDSVYYTVIKNPKQILQIT